SQVTFDRTVLSRIAEEHLQRLGVAATALKHTSGEVNVAAFIYLGRRYGASVARDAANNPIHYWVGAVSSDGSRVYAARRGRLTRFARLETVPVNPAVQSFDDARRQAATAIEDFFGQSVSKLDLERESRGEVYGFAWRRPEKFYGLQEHYTANVDGRGISWL